MRGGKIGDLRIDSQAGARCRVRNPFSGKSVVLIRNGKMAETLAGAVLEFETSTGEAIVLQSPVDPVV